MGELSTQRDNIKRKQRTRKTQGEKNQTNKEIVGSLSASPGKGIQEKQVFCRSF